MINHGNPISPRREDGLDSGDDGDSAMMGSGDGLQRRTTVRTLKLGRQLEVPTQLEKSRRRATAQRRSSQQ